MDITGLDNLDIDDPYAGDDPLAVDCVGVLDLGGVVYVFEYDLDSCNPLIEVAITIL